MRAGGVCWPFACPGPPASLSFAVSTECMTDTEAKVIAAWKQAAADLGIEFTSPFIAPLADGAGGCCSGAARWSGGSRSAGEAAGGSAPFPLGFAGERWLRAAEPRALTARPPGRICAGTGRHPRC
jgi:hypothetical protein